MKKLERRGPMMVVYDILMTVREPLPRTRIAYGANLGGRAVEPYLQRLMEEGIIEITDQRGDPRKARRKGKYYILTDKGRKLCKQLEHVFDQTGIDWYGRVPKRGE